jgi:hypothetical protein
MQVSMPHVTALHVWPADTDTPVACDTLVLDWDGIVGDRHYGRLTASDSRMTKTYERGTEVLNHRQISLVDEAELAIIAAAMGINALAAGVIADNICTSGVADLTMIPRMTRMKFEGGAVLMLGGENNPCTIAGAMVEAVHGTPPQAFPKAAIHRRGVTAWVEHPGSIHAGEAFTLISP